MSSNTVMGEQNICQLKNLNYIFFADDKKRKSKWDNQPSSNVTGSRGGLPGVINPSVMTGSASGTKSTVMPAVGNI
jgi:hypothetical protein